MGSTNLDGFFAIFRGKNTHNFVKNDAKFENKDLLHAKFSGARHEKTFRSQSCDIHSRFLGFLSQTITS